MPSLLPKIPIYPWPTAFLACKTQVSLTPLLPPGSPWPERTYVPRCPVYLLVGALTAQPVGFACPPVDCELPEHVLIVSNGQHPAWSQ